MEAMDESRECVVLFAELGEAGRRGEASVEEGASGSVDMVNKMGREITVMLMVLCTVGEIL